ncbi:NAD(P)-binding protein [Wolfiporia cocos MD-104 SS10]|uniref:NAD(P)-binding protein n=1 Tax=Wolfiporia cocos (strain MD-104) TaxID=742152 RepID=A0A2H3JR80_WOLCO|nr:NAD(P)-binding protein [Wolfiporia cocos MD-104 SS10]
MAAHRQPAARSPLVRCPVLGSEDTLVVSLPQGSILVQQRTAQLVRPRTSEMPHKPIQTAVLGVGLGGLAFHIPFVLALPQHFTLRAVWERNPAGAGGKLTARFGAEAAAGVTICRTYEDILSDDEIELVVISTPSATHYDGRVRADSVFTFIMAVLGACGGSVLVDKPVTATAAEARALGALARDQQRVLYPYQNCRLNADFLALRALLALPPSDARGLGALYEFESRYDRYRTSIKGTWKDSPAPANGAVYDLGSHLVDQALVLFGRPARVTAFIDNVRGIGSDQVDDCFTIYLHYPPRPSTGDSPHPTSFTVILRSHILSVRAPQLRYVVRGTAGTYTKFGIDVQEAQLKAMPTPAEITTSPTYGQEPAELYGSLENLSPSGEVIKSTWPTTAKGNYAAIYEDLAHAVREGRAQAIRWEESTEVIETIELAYQSAREGRTFTVPPRA